MTGDQEKERTISPSKQLCLDFSSQTSLHGVHFVLGSWLSKPRRFIWLVIILFQLVGFSVVVVNQVISVYRYPLLTKVITRYEDHLQLPAVTLCRELDFLSLYTENRAYLNNLSKQELTNVDIAEFVKRKSLELPDLVSGCMFSSYRDCTHNVKKTWSSSGLCYTINGPVTERNKSDVKENLSPNFVTSFPGVMGGLRLKLSMSRSPTALTGHSVAIIIHEPEEKIFSSTTEFVKVSRGADAFIGIKVRQNKFLPPPYQAYGNKVCEKTTEDFRHPLVPDGKYTLRACHGVCFLRRIEYFCGCGLDLREEDKYCDPLSLKLCLSKYSDLLSNDSVVSNFSCECPFPCEEVIYDTTLSSVPIGETSSLNFSMVYIYFDRLLVESTEQVKDYATWDVLATIGGQMGLFLGASIITVVEVLELTLRCLWAWCKRRSANSVNSLPPERRS